MLSLNKLKISFPLIRRNIRDWAFTIIIVGGQLGIYLNIFLINLNWNNILMPLSIIFIPNWKNTLCLKFPSLSNNLKIGISFFLLTWLYMCFQTPDEYTVRLFLFTSVFGCAIATLDRTDISLQSVIRKVWLLSLVCAICGFYLFQTGLFYKLSEGSNESIAEIINKSHLVTGAGCCVGIAAALCYKYRNKLEFILIVTSIVVEFIVLIFTSKRTPLITAIAIIFIYLLKFCVTNYRKFFGTVISIALGGSILVILLDNYFQIISLFDELIEYTSSGIYDVANGTTTSGNISARYRHLYINNGLDYINTEFNLINYIFGAGINAAKMTDVPLLQSFVDMGLIGIIAYGYFIIILPIKTIVSSKSKNKELLFVALLQIYGIVSCMNSGIPYSMIRWTLAMILVFALTQHHSIQRPSK